MTTLLTAETWPVLERFDDAVKMAPVHDAARTREVLAAPVRELRASVSVEAAARCLAEAADADDEARMRVATRALEALRGGEPLWTDAALARVLTAGLGHASAAARRACVKRVAVELVHVPPDAAVAAAQRIVDEDTGVATAAMDLVTRAVSVPSVRGAVLSHIAVIVSSNPLKQLPFQHRDAATIELRCWDAGVAVCQDLEAVPSDVAPVLEPLMAALSKGLTDDPLLALNVVEIVRRVLGGKAGRRFVAEHKATVAALWNAAASDPIVGDACLVLCASLLAKDEFEQVVGDEPTKRATDAFLDIAATRLRDGVSVPALEALAVFVSDERRLMAAARSSHTPLKAWVARLLQAVRPGAAEEMRIAGFDALATMLRSGSVVPHEITPASASDDATINSVGVMESASRALSTHAYDAEVLTCLISAVKNLEPKIQVAGFAAMRMLVGQADVWGIRAVMWDDKLRSALLDESMPSPVASKESMEWRFAATSACVAGGPSRLATAVGADAAHNVQALVARGPFRAATSKGHAPQADVATDTR